MDLERIAGDFLAPGIELSFQDVPGQDAARLLHQRLEQRVFASRQCHRRAVDRYLPGGGIET